MARTTFQDATPATPITADWLNGVDAAVYGGSLVGQQGIQGVPGATGPVGPQGTQGVPGAGTSTAGIVNVKDYGALGDGTTDDTAAILAGYEAACLIKGTLLFPSGNYTCSGIDLGGTPHRGCTFQGAAYDGRGNGYLSARITLKAGANRSLFKYLAGDAPHQIFRYLVLDGNDTVQTVSDFIVKSDDDLVTAYPFGFFMEFVHLVNGRGGGLKLGKRRGWNYLDNVTFYNNGSGNAGHGIYIDTYDVTMHHCNIGNSYGYGVYINSTSQLECNSVNTYVNQLGGMYIGAGVTDMAFSNGSVDHNARFGIQSAKRTSTVYPGARVFTGTRFLCNSSVGDGQFPDVMVQSGDTDFIFSGCSFMGTDIANRSAYAIQFADATGSVKIGPCKFAPAASFRWGIVSNAAQVITDNRIS